MSMCAHEIGPVTSYRFIESACDESPLACLPPGSHRSGRSAKVIGCWKTQGPRKCLPHAGPVSDLLPPPSPVCTWSSLGKVRVRKPASCQASSGRRARRRYSLFATASMR
eukprot:scaffold139983_cov21-Tisochrysis_lutea.AAC.4